MLFYFLFRTFKYYKIKSYTYKNHFLPIRAYLVVDLININLEGGWIVSEGY